MSDKGIPTIVAAPAIGFSLAENYLREELKGRGKSKVEIDEILQKENKALTSKYNHNIKGPWHESDIKSAYESYVKDVTSMIEEVKSLISISNASKNKVQNAKNESGSNSEEEVSASNAGSAARIKIEKLNEQINARKKEYEREKIAADRQAGQLLIKFYNLPVLSKSVGGRKTRKLKRSKKLKHSKKSRR